MKRLFFVLSSFIFCSFSAFASNTVQIRISVDKKFVLPDGSVTTRVVKNLDAKSLTVLLPMTPAADEVISSLDSGNYVCNASLASNLVMTYATWLQPVYSISDCK